MLLKFLKFFILIRLSLIGNLEVLQCELMNADLRGHQFVKKGIVLIFRRVLGPTDGTRGIPDPGFEGFAATDIVCHLS